MIDFCPVIVVVLFLILFCGAVVTLDVVTVEFEDTIIRKLLLLL